MQGLLLIDKPAGWTSFDVVNYVRKLARQASSQNSQIVGLSDSQQRTTSSDSDNTTMRLSDNKTKSLPKVKVGHTGTLDPLATGLLVLAVGKDYTRRMPELTKLDKTYEVVMKLGYVSTTGDAEGEIMKYQPSELRHSEQSEESINRSFANAQDDTRVKVGAVLDTTPTPEAVLEALESLQGHIMQVPPAFSAMKIDGKRAYKLAREGKEVKLEARPVTIYKNELTSYEYPYVHFTSDVGSGTYIRSLVEDLGKLLATGAYMSALRRTRVGQFAIADAHTPDAENLLNYVFPL